MGAQRTTRDRLVQSAIQLLWERTYQATSVDDLCAHANARKGSFYYYFPTKVDLAVAAVETSWALTRERVMEPVFAGDPPGLARIDALVDQVEKVQAQARKRTGAYLGCPFGGLGQEVAHRDARLRSTIQQVFDGHCDYLGGALERAERLGEVPRGDARRRARSIFALFEGALLLAKVADDPRLFRAIVSRSLHPLAAS